MTRVTHVFAGVPVRDLAAALPWYERLLGRPPDSFPHEREALWHLSGGGSLYVVVDPDRAGRALVTLALDAGERRVEVDPDGNRVQLFRDPSA